MRARHAGALESASILGGTRLILAITLTAAPLLSLGSPPGSSAQMNSIEAACTVPGTHSSIQQAVDDLACDDVTLTKDSYLESVTISRSLSLTGAPSLIEGEITITGDNTAVAVDGISIVALFSDGFESGDLSAWSDTVP